MLCPSPTLSGPLTITDVEVFSLRHRLPRAIGPATVLSPYRSALLVKLTAEGGLTGWGETADLGGARGYLEQHARSVLLGQDAFQHRRLWRDLWGPNFGDGRAVAAADLALHDLRGQALGLSVGEMYGGRLRDRVPAYAAAMNYVEGIPPEEQHPAEAVELVRRGFRALKLRTGRVGFQRDLAVARAVREAVGPEIRLMADGNGGFTLPGAHRFGRELEQLGFQWFEEPMPQGLNYAGYEALPPALDMAIAGGEALDSRVAARDLIARRCFDIIQPDVALCGGIAETLFIAEMARLWSIQCIPHCWGGAITLAGTLHVLSLLPNENWGFSSEGPLLEFDTYENPFREEIVAVPFALDEEGRVAVPSGPGLGIKVQEEVVRRYATDP